MIVTSHRALEQGLKRSKLVLFEGYFHSIVRFDYPMQNTQVKKEAIDVHQDRKTTKDTNVGTRVAR